MMITRARCIENLETEVNTLIELYDQRQMVASTYHQVWQDAYRNVEATSDASARRQADSIAQPERQALAEIEAEILIHQELRDYFRTILPYTEEPNG